MPIGPEIPVIVEDPDPGSAGEALNAWAEHAVTAWAASANAGSTGEGIFERDLELPTYDDIVDAIEAARDALILAGVDVTTDPIPAA